MLDLEYDHSLLVLSFWSLILIGAHECTVLFRALCSEARQQWMLLEIKRLETRFSIEVRCLSLTSSPT